jgi:CMP-N-acetylneuraminic acid synthetase
MKKNKFTAITFIRENSNRLPKKSVLKFGERLLFEHSLDAYNNTNLIDEIIVYTSSQKVKSTIEKNNKDEKSKIRYIKRDKKFDKDVSFNEIMKSIASKLNTEFIVYFCVTSPFIKSKTIDELLSKIDGKEYDSGFTCHPIKNFCWYKDKALNYNLDKKIPFTQDLSPVFVETSALYVFKRDLFLKENRRVGYKPYMKTVSKVEGIDIDYPEDLQLAKYFLERT